MAEKPIRPRVHVLVLCDEIEDRLDEGSPHLLGIRTELSADSFPYVHPALYVYMQLTGHHGRGTGAVLLQLPESDRILRRIALPPIQFLGPLRMIPVSVALTNCEFPEPGVYYIQVTFGGVLIAERFFEVYQSHGEED